VSPEVNEQIRKNAYRKWTRPADDIFADALLKEQTAQAKEL
jgi:hypothetical protein